MPGESVPQGLWLPPRVATLLVVASDALDRTRAQADYLCDGVADDVEINAALNALPAGDGRVMLSEGTFNITSPIIIPASNIALEGQGWSTFIDGDGLATGEHGIVISDHMQCWVRNLMIQTEDGGGKVSHCIFIEDHANSFVIEKVRFLTSDSDSIHVEGISISKGWIIDCYFYSSDEHAIHVDMDAGEIIEHLHIERNLIRNAGLDGIHFSPSGGDYDCAICDNILYNGDRDGIAIEGGTLFAINGNLIRNSAEDGISVDGGAFFTINDNLLEFNLGYGISLTNVDDTTVEDNNIKQSNLHNIYLNTCAQVLVQGNYSYGAQDDAADNIHLDTNCSDSQVLSNFSIWAGRYGIYLGGSRQACSGNLVQSSGDDGIVIDAADFQANDNRIYDCGRDIAGTYHGIKVTGTSDRGQINSNLIESDGAVTEDGIHLQSNAQYIQIVGNYVFDMMGSGIHLIDDNDYCLLKDNYCLENDDYGINIAAATCADNTVKNNKLVGNVTGQINDTGTRTQLPEVVIDAPNPDSNIGEFPAQQMLDGVDTEIRMKLHCPADFQELVRARVVLVPGGTGNLRRSVNTDFGRICADEAYNTHSDSIAAGQVAVTANELECIDIDAAIDGIAGSDWIGVRFTREAVNVLDTIGATVWLLGLRMQYV